MNCYQYRSERTRKHDKPGTASSTIGVVGADTAFEKILAHALYRNGRSAETVKAQILRAYQEWTSLRGLTWIVEVSRNTVWV
ncbi:MAG TPA: hypothetical protein DIS90_08770 [Cytophagales bacterium]|nr:hypothetical protein [Cytophagales bacterium]